MNKELLMSLQANRRSEILEGLYKLGGQENFPPTEKLLKMLISLLNHTDADIREQAVNVAGIHWQLKEAYPTLIAMLRGKEKELKQGNVALNSKNYPWSKVK